MHGNSTGRVVAACAVAECKRRRLGTRVSQIRAIAVGQECRRRGLAMQMVQMGIAKEVLAGAVQGGGYKQGRAKLCLDDY